MDVFARVCVDGVGIHTVEGTGKNLGGSRRGVRKDGVVDKDVDACARGARGVRL